MGPYLIRIFLWIGVVALLSSALPAQDSTKTTSVVIEVTDASGGVAPYARVDIASPTKDIGEDLMVDVDGKLRLELTPGVYTVNVQSFGFASLKRRLEVQIASPQTVSVVLQPYSCSDGCGLEYSSLLLDPSLATSPDRRFAILEDVHARPDHKFFLIDRDFTTQRKLFSSSKPVKALWGYDSRAIVVTDYPHGDIYHTKVFPVDVNLPPIRLLDLIARQLTETEREDLEGRLSRLHITIEALKWVKQTELELTLSGFDDKAQKNFKETYVLPIDFHAGSTAPIWPK